MHLVFPALLALHIILSVFSSLKNASSLPVSAVQVNRIGFSSTTRDHSNLAQISSSHAVVLKHPKIYTDEEVTKNPLVFNNVSKYELFQELSSEGIDSSKHVVEYHFYTKFEIGVLVPANCQKILLISITNAPILKGRQ